VKTSFKKALGLFNAVINFSIDYNTSFDDYASLCIRNRILRAVRMATQLKQKVLSDAFPLEDDPYYLTPPLIDSKIEETVLGQISVDELSQSFRSILSPMELDIINLKIADASVDEMSLAVGLSKKQVENALFRARRKIAIFLKNEFDLYRESGKFLDEFINFPTKLDDKEDSEILSGEED
jgi:RNA polymerase sporulation-specific sigma factor